MSKRSSKGRLDLNQLAKRIVDEAIGDAPKTEAPLEKSMAAITLGRLGGIKGGSARAKKLTAQERSQIARIAASARWETGKVKMQWHKILTDSDAQQDTLGAKMPFLRFTKENIFDDHRTWFREVFFANLRWIPNKDKDGRDYEEASINVHVIILKNDIGVRQMHLDHKPHRANNHGAPTTHLHYDEKTRRALEKQSLTGHQIIVEKNLQGTFSLSVL